MALSGQGLLAAMVAKLGEAADPALQESVLKPICEAMIEYLVANAVVSVAVPATGLSAPDGPVTGSASGTGTVS